MAMDEMDDLGKAMEMNFGLISGFYVFALWEYSTAAGSKWDFNDISTIDIVVNKNNAAAIYDYCKAIRSGGYNVGISKKVMSKIKEARLKAHQFLWDEANDPSTPIERKIELVKLTSKHKTVEKWDW